MIHMILYEEESKGLMTREDIYKMARALSRDYHANVTELKETAQVPLLPIEGNQGRLTI